MRTKQISDPTDELGRAADRLFHLAAATAPPNSPVEYLLGGALQAASAPLRHQGLEPFRLVKAYAYAFGTTIALCAEADMPGLRDPFWRLATHAYDSTQRVTAGEGGVVVTGPRLRGH